MKHPLEFIPAEKRKPLFFSLLALTLILFAVFRVLDQPLRTPAAPNGIVSFELAWSPGASVEIVNSWSEYARLVAAFGLGLDYLFMPAYALTLSLGVLLAAGRRAGAFARVGVWLGWGALAAALFDAAENFALWQLMLGDFQALWPRLANICATVKFSLLLIGLAYALVGGLWPRRR